MSKVSSLTHNPQNLTSLQEVHNICLEMGSGSTRACFSLNSPLNVSDMYHFDL